MMNKQEIMSDMKSIIQITMCYYHPSVPDVGDWHAVHLVAETVYDELGKGEDEVGE